MMFPYIISSLILFKTIVSVIAYFFTLCTDQGKQANIMIIFIFPGGKPHKKVTLTEDQLEGLVDMEKVEEEMDRVVEDLKEKFIHQVNVRTSQGKCRQLASMALCYGFDYNSYYFGLTLLLLSSFYTTYNIISIEPITSLLQRIQCLK